MGSTITKQSVESGDNRGKVGTIPKVERHKNRTRRPVVREEFPPLWEEKTTATTGHVLFGESLTPADEIGSHQSRPFTQVGSSLRKLRNVKTRISGRSTCFYSKKNFRGFFLGGGFRCCLGRKEERTIQPGKKMILSAPRSILGGCLFCKT